MAGGGLDSIPFEEVTMTHLPKRPQEALPPVDAGPTSGAFEQADLREVLPFLARTPLLAGCPEDFLRAIAEQLLAPKRYQQGQVVCTVGDAAGSMLVVLEGTLELVSKANTVLAQLSKYGALGEVEALGLFKNRMATARTLTPCRILAVPAEALVHALDGPQAGPMKEGFARLIASRHKQVETGVPLTALNVSANADDITVKAMALQAEQLRGVPGSVLEPFAEADPCGAHVTVIVRGKVVVEVGAEGAEGVTAEPMPVAPGSLLPDGLLADYEAYIRVVSADVEAYRIRLSDLRASAQLLGKAPDWFYHFRLLYDKARDAWRTRLSSVRSALRVRDPHPADNGIRDWSERRQKSLKRAEKLRRENANSHMEKNAGFMLPLLNADDLGTTAYRSRPFKQVRGRVTPQHQGRGKLAGMDSLQVYSVMKGLRDLKLPKIASEPSLRELRELRAAKNHNKKAAPAQEDMPSKDWDSSIQAEYWL